MTEEQAKEAYEKFSLSDRLLLEGLKQLQEDTRLENIKFEEKDFKGPEIKASMIILLMYKAYEIKQDI